MANDWEIPSNEIKILRKIGEGSFGEVYLARWRETMVVTKVMHENLGEKHKTLVLKEFDAMTKLHHPNVVQLFGYINDPFAIVMEYFPNGNLLDNINSMSKSRKKRIALEVARGILYLHNRKPHSMIHRDIKPCNVFLTDSYRAKIGDFGISKFDVNAQDSSTCLSSFNHTTEVGTVRYMAPEANTDTYSNSVDIYSFGILLYELFENKRYHPDYKMTWNWWNTSKTLRYLINNMVSINPNVRYKINDVYFKLTEMFKTL